MHRPEAAAFAAPQAEPSICLDPGHDDTYVPGAVARDSSGRILFTEQELTLQVAYRLKALLEQEAEVCVSRDETGKLHIEPRDEDADGRLSQGERVQPRIDHANQFGAHILVSLHFNSWPDPALSGTEVYYSAVGEHRERNRQLAQHLLDSLSEELRANGYEAANRGLKSDYYWRSGEGSARRLYTLGNNPESHRRGQWRAGTLVEVLFLSNPQDVGFLRRDDALDIIARGLHGGIAAYRQNIQATEIGKGNPEANQIALTFDCGASSKPTPAILDALGEAGVTSTFFVTGDWARHNPELLQRIAAEGHELGNHTLTHRNLTSLSAQDIRRELNQVERLVRALTGKTTRPLWRAPFGARDERVLKIAAEEGWNYHVFWSLQRQAGRWVSGDSGDWRDISPAQVKANVLNAARIIGSGLIVVHHCGSQQTAQVLPEIIAELQEMGYQLTTVSEVAGLAGP